MPLNRPLSSPSAFGRTETENRHDSSKGSHGSEGQAGRTVSSFGSQEETVKVHVWADAKAPLQDLGKTKQEIKDLRSIYRDISRITKDQYCDTTATNHQRSIEDHIDIFPTVFGGTEAEFFDSPDPESSERREWLAKSQRLSLQDKDLRDSYEGIRAYADKWAEDWRKLQFGDQG